jgi:hypothetical protein
MLNDIRNKLLYGGCDETLKNKRDCSPRVKEVDKTIYYEEQNTEISYVNL